MAWRKNQKRFNPDGEDGAVEIFASTEHGVVTLQITAIATGECTTISFSPELSYKLAQRITLAAIKVEEAVKDA